MWILLLWLWIIALFHNSQISWHSYMVLRLPTNFSMHISLATVISWNSIEPNRWIPIFSACTFWLNLSTWRFLNMVWDYVFLSLLLKRTRSCRNSHSQINMRLLFLIFRLLKIADIYHLFWKLKIVVHWSFIIFLCRSCVPSTVNNN